MALESCNKDRAKTARMLGITQKQLQSKIQEYHLEKLVIETQKQLTAVEKKIEAGDNRRQLIEQYTNLKKLDRETVEKLIDYIEVGKRIPGTRQVPVDIHWNF